MGKEQWWCGHPGIEGEGWKQVGERDERNLGIASVSKFECSFRTFLPEVFSFLAGVDVGTYGHDETWMRESELGDLAT